MIYVPLKLLFIECPRAKINSRYLLFHLTLITSYPPTISKSGIFDFEGLPASSPGASLAQVASICTNHSKANLDTGWE